jgi:two-component system sensor histidine kinase KdpD
MTAPLLPDYEKTPRSNETGIPRPSEAENSFSQSCPKVQWEYLWAAAASLSTAVVAIPLLSYLNLANIIMVFLLTVVLVAARLGRGPAVVATIVAVLAFDFFYVPPRFSLGVMDLQYLVTFMIMLGVGLITSHLTANLRYQAHVAADRESRSRALYEFARELSGALETQQIFDATRSFIQHTFHAKATLLLPDDAGHLQLPPLAPIALTKVSPISALKDTCELDMSIAQWSFDNALPAGIGTDTLPHNSFFYLPLVAPMRTRGLLAIKPESRYRMFIPEQRQQLDTFATLAAIALERVHYIEIAQDALIRVESERLRNSLLSALSHDLRTPLTSLMGLSESIAMSKSLTPLQEELAAALRDETVRMSRLVSNLLDMGRFQSGEAKLNLQWQSFEEVVGSALRASGTQLVKHRVETRLARDLPLVRFDAVLIERALCNLVENAGKYTPAGASIILAAEVSGRFLEIVVSDNGPGLPLGREEAVFEKFTRGERESAKPGVGLGLAICRAIVEAHAGTIHAERTPGGGASFVFTLPLGTPPDMQNMDEGTSNLASQGEMPSVATLPNWQYRIRGRK